MAMTFEPEVERWRSLVAKYVTPALVDKVLWTIKWESGGKPGNIGDGGASTGLLQVQNSSRFPNRPSTEQLLDPEFNIRYAVENLGIGQGNFSAWGENNSYNGKPFGSLGNHPFPSGSSNPSSAVSNYQAQRQPSWASAPITQGFGPTDETLDGPYGGYAHFNKGYDYGVAAGTPIDAAAAGTVVSAGDSGDGWGISVKVKDANGFTHNYGHLSSAVVKPGQAISAGTIVGASGSSGKSTGAHLSYDVWDSSGNFVDPGRWVNGMAEPPSLPMKADEYMAAVGKYYALKSALDKKYTDPLTNEAIPPDPNDPDVIAFNEVQAQLDAYKTAQDRYGQDWQTYLDIQTYNNENDPAKLAATNAAARYSREFGVRNLAEQTASTEFGNQASEQAARQKSMTDFLSSPSYLQGVPFTMPSQNLPNKEQLFKSNVDRIKAGLPDVPDFTGFPQIKTSQPAATTFGVDMGQGQYGPAAPKPIPSATPKGYNVFGGGPIGLQAQAAGVNPGSLSRPNLNPFRTPIGQLAKNRGIIPGSILTRRY